MTVVASAAIRRLRWGAELFELGEGAFVFDIALQRDRTRSVVALFATLGVVGSHALAHVSQPLDWSFGVTGLTVGTVLAVGAAWAALRAAGVGASRPQRPVGRTGRVPVVGSLWRSQR